MVMVNVGGVEFGMDGYLKDNLDIAKEAIAKDFDMMFVIDGQERAGKSVLAQQIGGYLDPTLCLDRICFTPLEFREAILKAKKHECVIYDEAFTGLSSRAAMSKVNKALIQMMAEIGQKNLYVIICCPSIHELDRYPAVWRSRALLHVYMKGFERGYFSFFNYDKKKLLYMTGKKFFTYSITPNFRGRFPKPYIVDEAAYREKKLQALNAPPEDTDSTYLTQRNGLMAQLAAKGMKHEEIAEMVGLSRSAVTRGIKRAQDGES